MADTVPVPTNDPFERLRGVLPPRHVTARVVASQAKNTRCGLLTVANASHVALDRVLERTVWAAPFGQAQSAIARGISFEQRVKADGYGPLIALFRNELGFPVEAARVENLKERFPHRRNDPEWDMRHRARATRQIVASIIAGDPDAPNLVDGAILPITLGGKLGYLETDALALRVDERMRVAEIKSFPIVDQRIDPDKLGEAADQSAVYVAALENLVESLGADPCAFVSSEVVLITPRNTGMQPTLSRIAVDKRVRHLREQLAESADAAAILASIPEGVTFPQPDTDPVPVLETLATYSGTWYRPSCLAFCGLARWCRARAQDDGDPAALGETAVRLLPGIRSTQRALELASGAPATLAERAASEALARAQAVLDAAGEQQ